MHALYIFYSFSLLSLIRFGAFIGAVCYVFVCGGRVRVCVLVCLSYFLWATCLTIKVID